MRIIPNQIKVNDLTATEALNGSVDLAKTEISQSRQTTSKSRSPVPFAADEVQVEIQKEERVPLALLLLKGTLTADQLADLENNINRNHPQKIHVIQYRRD